MDDERIRILEEGRRDGMTLAEVARRHEISRSMLYDWRYRRLLGIPVPFMRLVPVESGARPDVVPPLPAPQPPAMTIDLRER
jgi:transposase